MRCRAASAIVPVGLGCVAILVFLPALRNGFVFDDVPNLAGNPHYRGLGWAQLRWMATAIHMGHYIPLTWLSLAVDYRVWGMNPLGYHLSNVVLHGVNTGLFYFVALRLLRRSTTLTGSPLRVASMVATLFFAIHPLRVESVAWVTERRDVLSGAFLFITVLLYLRACEAEGLRRRGLLAASVGAFALALASKSILMTLPAILVVLNVYPLRRLSLGDSWAGVRRVSWEMAPFLLLSALSALPAYAAQAAASALGTYSWPTRIAVAFYALWFYLVKTLLPLDLSPLYEVPIPLNLLEPRFVISVVGVVVVSASALALRRRWPAGLALWMYYVLALSPTLGIVVRAGFQLAADRYSYVGCLGWALLVGAGAGVAARAGERGVISRGLARLAAAGVFAWLIGLGVLTWQQVQIWRDQDSLWSWAVRVNPDCALCQTNLGLVRLAQGVPASALPHLERAVRLRPDRVLVRMDLGLALERLGRVSEAVAEYEAVVAQRPDAVRARRQLALALHRMDRQEDSVAQLRIASRLAPNDAAVQVSLGLALTEIGRPADAVALFRRAVELGPETASARDGLVQAYLALGLTALARQELDALEVEDPQRAERLRPKLSGPSP